MLFFLDECLPASVGRVLEQHGHEVRWTRDILPAAAPDPLVATISEIEGAILVSNDKDFKSLAPQIPDGQKRRFRTLSRITMRCGEVQAAKRLEAALSFIEHEYELAQKRHDKRILIEIRKASITSHR